MTIYTFTFNANGFTFADSNGNSYIDNGYIASNITIEPEIIMQTNDTISLNSANLNVYDSVDFSLMNSDTVIVTTNLIKNNDTQSINLNGTAWNKIKINFNDYDNTTLVSSTEITITNISYGVSSSAVGDPYIKPCNSDLIKLPDKYAHYRLLEAENLYINATVDCLDQDEINNKTKILQELYFTHDNKSFYDWKSMFFFTKIGITYNQEYFEYDLIRQKHTRLYEWMSLGEKYTWIHLKDSIHNCTKTNP